ncbi:cytochrome P450 20A1-like [Glandiceps talaboti]
MAADLRLRMELFDFMLPVFGKMSITINNGPRVKRLRKHFDVPLGYAAIKSKYCHFQQASDEMMAKISALPAREHIPLSEYMSILILKGFSRAAYGDVFKEEKEAVAFLHDYDITWEILNKTIAADEEKNEEFKRALKGWKGFVSRVIEQRRNNPPGEGEWSMLDVLMKHSESEEHLFDEASTYLVNGFHTTVFMLVFTIYFLAEQPKLQDKMYEELIDVLGEDGKVDHNTLSKLVYVRQVIDESLRIQPIAPFTIRTDFESDVEIQGYTIPKGVGCVHALGVVLTDSKIWPEPERFDPDRFSREEVSKRHKLAFAPFGTGKRICPGYRITYAETVVFLADFFRKFTLELVEGQTSRPKWGLVTQPREEIWVIATKREAE